jgi:hypothetical protein
MSFMMHNRADGKRRARAGDWRLLYEIDTDDDGCFYRLIQLSIEWTSLFAWEGKRSIDMVESEALWGPETRAFYIEKGARRETDRVAAAKGEPRGDCVGCFTQIAAQKCTVNMCAPCCRMVAGVPCRRHGRR